MRPQIVGDGAEGEGGFVLGVGGGHGQCQGQSSAQADDVGRGGGLGGEPFRPQPPCQRLVGLGLRGQGEGEGFGAFRRDQAGESVAAGDQGEAAVAGGQQGTDLLFVAGVVQDEEDPPVGEEAAEEGAAAGDVLKDVLGGDAEGGEEAVQGVTGFDGGCVGVEPAQVDEELSVGEGGGDLVGVVDCEGGLADTRSTADDDDGSTGRTWVSAHGGQPGALRLPPRENRQITGQLRRTYSPWRPAPAVARDRISPRTGRCHTGVRPGPRDIVDRA